MRAVIQRVTSASVTVDGEIVGELDIGTGAHGLVALVGVTHDDTSDHARALADKIWRLRILDEPPIDAVTNDAVTNDTVTNDTATNDIVANDADSAARQSRPRQVSAADVDAPILVISQFTLYADTAKGRRPSWNAAAGAAAAEPLVEAVVAALREVGATVATGRFGADMSVRLVNDGPVTILLEV